MLTQGAATSSITSLPGSTTTSSSQGSSTTKTPEVSPSPSPSSTASSSSSSSSFSSKTGAIVGGIVGTVVAVLLLALAYWFLLVRPRSKKRRQAENDYLQGTRLAELDHNHTNAGAVQKRYSRDPILGLQTANAAHESDSRSISELPAMEPVEVPG